MAKTRARSTNTHRLRKSNLRGDIQGLRAVAVILVIADHLFHWPSGGFIGVDVFFVISGFLITGLLLREYRATGTLSFSSFYRRRIKRIAPAATLVLVATVSASALLLNVGRANQTFVDAIWSFFFIGNWRFASAGTDYFQSSGPVSPLQHFWSLAIEEQFYFVWPWLMLLIFVVGGRSSKWSGAAAVRALAIAMSAIVLMSFVWSVYESANAPTWAYFSTLSRAWELGVGALLAVGASLLVKLPQLVRPFLAWAGLAGIAFSTIAISSESFFPAPWGALPVFSTALVIAAGTGGNQAFLKPLANPVTSYLGDISYSLYLWHFPVIVILEALLPDRGGIFYILNLGLIAFLSVIAFELVENPVRKSRWLEKNPKTKVRGDNASSNVRIKVFGMLALVVASALLVTVALVMHRPTADAYVATPSAQGADSGSESDVEELSPRENELIRSADLETWPELSPSIEDLPNSRAPEWDTDGCLDVDDSNLSECAYGDGEKLAVLLGDSVAISYMPAIRAGLADQGWRIQVLTRHQCPAINVSVRGATGEKTVDESCDAHHEWVRSKVAELQPDLIIASSAEDSLRRLDSGVEGTAAAAAEWLAVSTGSVADISALAARTVVLSPPPQGNPIATCATQINGPRDCTSSTSGTLWQAMTGAETEAFASVGTPEHVVEYANTRDWFCTIDDRCPALFGTTPIRVDASHLTGAYSESLGTEMRSVLLG
jgi:peptidoglycan/LPS O-acetylase OafA/YrhL